jgi:uncharacterized protein YidB (DUF937 family)
MASESNQPINAAQLRHVTVTDLLTDLSDRW